ncbi:DUF4139 domain-containing protein [Parasulfuritortus cantonensis]|uniref:DUF4139 domain-containing protein n=1 Tax=Parasulfuritortus cantonensis TaxID=2528202 RepID=A0A4R1B6V5_9PROT|nr:DUF4139 domain-containing protein [Parasulfuritortus cantonensis]TCJ11775.1 DUF4139 domain-containing protein [Parasulfuritortus cantonensis]
MKSIALAILLGLASTAWGAERLATDKDQTGLAVTIYNGDLALVKDARKVRLEAGENQLAWRNVSARMQPETALLRSLDGKPLSLLEQNFDFDLLTPQKLLEKSVGEAVRVVKTHPTMGTDSYESATVLSANDGVVLQFKDRVETGVPGRLAFDHVPANLRDRPTLSMLLDAGKGGEQGLELSYLTGGLSWKADYVAELSGKEDSLDLNGWVTLTNVSGTAYHDAQLQLVAGEINRARPEVTPMKMMRDMVAMAAPTAAMQEESLLDYHLYTLERPTTILDNQTKQVALLSAQRVPASKEYLLQGAEYYYSGQYGELGRKLKPAIYLQFDNKGGQLGVPLPKGIVRVYKKDRAGRAQFVGEDRIDHTAKNETVRLRLGEAFDITADKKQTDYQKIAAGLRGGVYETAYQIEIRNAKNEPVEVKVAEPMPGEWQMVSESLKHDKDSAHTAVWRVPVAAEGKTVLSWRVRVKY